MVASIICSSNRVHKEKVMRKLKDNVISLSKHQQGSNIVEKCLTTSKDPQLKQEFLVAIVTSLRSDSEKCNLIDLIRDKYANYVIQSVLDLSCPETREILIGKLVESAPLIKK